MNVVFRLKNTAVLRLKYTPGAKGPQGDAATIAVGDVTTGAPGTDAEVANSGTANDAVFDFTIPRGDNGLAATIAVGSVTASAPGSTPSITNVGTATAATFDFVLPRGDTGPAGPAVSDGDKGDIVVSSSGTVYTIDTNVVSDTKLRQGTALTVIGRSANSTGNVADIAAGTDGFVLRRSGTTLGFGTVATAGIADDAVTFAKTQNIATARFLGRVTASSGDIEELTAAQMRTGTGSAASGANSDITSLAGLTTALSVAQGGTGDTGTAWTSYTPTFAANTGTITTATATGAYKKLGRTVHFMASLAVTTNGTGGGYISISLPFTAAARPFAFVGRDVGNTGKGLSASCAASGTTMTVANYDVTYPAVNGSNLIVSGTYESAT